MAVQFRVLGQVDACVDGHTLDLGHARRRSVLAVLLIEANQVVTADQLVEQIWNAAPAPRDPHSVLRTYLWHLRRTLAAVEDCALVRHGRGYQLEVDESCVDMNRFHALLARTETAGDDDRAAAMIEQALGLWRGEPFAGLDTPSVNATRQTLLLRRRAARLDLTDLRLRQGRHVAMLAELTRQAADDPLDERVTGQLMLALHRSGRSAQALAEFHSMRDRLVGELGTDPGAALQRLHQRILTADPALTAPADELATPRTRPAVVPRQLPAPPHMFIGRGRELAALSAALDRRVGQPGRDGQAGSGGTLMVSVIGGAGGMGKTWLALHWAHQHRDRFPDGQLYVDLRGFDCSGEPVPAEAAMHGFLTALGVGPAAIPSWLEAQAGLYRSLLAGKRVLVVLDNARDAAQVVPLLPGSPTCTVLVTSRHRMTGLISGHGAVPVDLDVLAEDEAHDLLSRYAGPDRVTAEPDALSDLVRHCAGLPLALGNAGARALADPHLPLAALAENLRDVPARLDALATRDRSPGLGAVTCWSYNALRPAAADALGLLPLAPGPDIGLPAAASLLGSSAAATRALLRDLEDASLVHQHTSGRYRMHDLVRFQAAFRAADGLPADEREAAIGRVLDFYTHAAHRG
jgi:DNA-binding SARP family transcriptional activator